MRELFTRDNNWSIEAIRAMMKESIAYSMCTLLLNMTTRLTGGHVFCNYNICINLPSTGSNLAP